MYPLLGLIPASRLEQHWQVLKDCNLECQLGKGPRRCPYPMGETSDSCFQGSRSRSQVAD